MVGEIEATPRSAPPTTSPRASASPSSPTSPASRRRRASRWATPGRSSPRPSGTAAAKKRRWRPRARRREPHRGREDRGRGPRASSRPSGAAGGRGAWPRDAAPRWARTGRRLRGGRTARWGLLGGTAPRAGFGLGGGARRRPARGRRGRPPRGQAGRPGGDLGLLHDPEAAEPAVDGHALAIDAALAADGDDLAGADLGDVPSSKSALPAVEVAAHRSRHVVGPQTSSPSGRRRARPSERCRPIAPGGPSRCCHRPAARS